MTKPSFKTHKKSCGFLRVNDQKTSKENSFEIKQEIVQFTKYVTRSYCPSDMKISMAISKKFRPYISKKHNPNRESAHSSHTAQWGGFKLHISFIYFFKRYFNRICTVVKDMNIILNIDYLK